MPNILPFHGIFFNKERAGEIHELIAPPYDVISPEEKGRFFSPYNITRLTLSWKENDYKERGKKWKIWKEKGVFIRQENPSYYLHYHYFPYEGKEILRKGFFAAVELSEYNKKEIIPHEATLPSPKEDRYKLLQVTGASLEPVFFLLPQGKEVINILEERREELIFSFSIGEERHLLWRISREDITREISLSLLHKKLYIADGHHRYETSLLYSKEDSSFKYILGYIVPLEEEGLIILPAHRLLKDIPEEAVKKLFTEGKKFFNFFPIQTTSFQEILKKEGEKHHAFIFIKKGLSPYLIKSINEKKVEKEILDHSPAWKKLDVSILHSVIFSEIMGMDEEELQKENLLSYIVGREKALDLIERGEFEGGFFLNPTRIEEVKRVADKGEKMPGKATYFYPKVPSGLIMFEP